MGEGYLYSRAAFRTQPPRHLSPAGDALVGSDADRRLSAEQGSAALLAAMLDYYARHHSKPKTRRRGQSRHKEA